MNTAHGLGLMGLGVFVSGGIPCPSSSCPSNASVIQVWGAESAGHLLRASATMERHGSEHTERE